MNRDIEHLIEANGDIDRTIRRLDEMTILEREGNEVLTVEDRHSTEVVLYLAVDDGLDRYFERKRRKDAADLTKVREELASLTKEKG